MNCSVAVLIAAICDENSEPGCYGQISMQFYQSGGAFRVVVTFQTGSTDCGQGDGQPRIEWEKTYVGPAPDYLLDHETLPWITNGVPTTERCDGSGATCVLTAIPGP